MGNGQIEYRPEVFYYSSGPSAAMAAVGATATVNIQIAGDAPFVVNKIHLMVTQASLVVGNWGGTVNIDFSNAGISLSNVAFPADLLTPIGRPVFTLDYPAQLAANTVLVITFTSPVVTATVCNLTLIGAKLKKRVG